MPKSTPWDARHHTISLFFACPEVRWHTFTSRGIPEGLQRRDTEQLLHFPSKWAPRLNTSVLWSQDSGAWLHQWDSIGDGSRRGRASAHMHSSGLASGISWSSLASAFLCTILPCWNLQEDCNQTKNAVSQYTLELPVLSRWLQFCLPGDTRQFSGDIFSRHSWRDAPDI